MVTLKQALDLGANINFYMYHGGTNFGFSNGAVSPYKSVITSYDYDAPISEAGDVTNKLIGIRDLISKVNYFNYLNKLFYVSVDD